MTPALDQTVTRLLGEASQGRPLAVEELVPLLYDELRRIAQNQLNGQGAQTLQATALVNEAFLRLVGRQGAGYENRQHFFFAAARAMRDILVEQARRRLALKRGGGAAREPIELVEVSIDEPSEDLLPLNDALTELEAEAPEKARLVMLRYFAGLTMEEVAAATGTPLRTLERDWRFARAWLHTKLAGNKP
ncbi:MAG: ECF-type sigma factor [Phycisphaerales bacterium]